MPSNNISFFSRLPFLVLLNRTKAIEEFATSDNSSSHLYQKYLFPLALCPSVVFLATTLLTPMNSQPLPVLFIGITLMSGISIMLVHLWSVLAEAVLVARKFPCSRIDAVKIGAVCATPWFLIFSLFPLIGGWVILGAVWSATLIKPAIEHFAHAPSSASIRISIAIFMLWVAAYFFSNLFFVGILSMAGG